ncbi:MULTISPECIES: MFS transporter [unclassified Staphylococcus]|uniref:MFS transporter n=1 Tax=unclassified Staphylococcus TaxID=91994 RepID=UPI0021CFB78C|nr:MULTISPECIES: MFS transporter [unclassified Staphylococcus]UXR77955.1 MFS transporter [Staphylococcus sp. IVB6227]UXR82116.1 MFS transporter [Staphylococcus sp. IVB6214]
MNRKLQDLLIIIIAGTGMLLSTLDTGIINVAISFLKGHFQTTTDIISFTISGYTLALAVSILPLGILSDSYGKLKISYLGFIIFGISSLICGFADSIHWLIVGRIFQGIGAAALQATSAALITTLVSEKRQNNAISILGVMIGLGPVLGPFLRGILISLNLWNFIFWINIPFTIIAIICNQYLINRLSEKTSQRPFDYLGFFLNTQMLVFLLIGLFLLNKHQFLVVSILLILLSLLLGTAFYHVESNNRNALVDIVNLKNNPKLINYLFQTFAFGFASAVIFLIPPFIFQQIYHLNIEQIRLLVLGAPAGLILFSKITGKLNDGSKNTLFSHFGLKIILLSLVFLLILSPNLPYLFLTLGLFTYGIGGGYFQPANIANIMQESPIELQGSTGALQRMIQNVSISIGSAIASTCINLWSDNLLLATRMSWGITLVIIFLSLNGVSKLLKQKN